MIWDIKRFYGEAEELLASKSPVSVYDYLIGNNYSNYFIDEHIIPMVSALWSSDFNSVKDYPLVYMLQFMKNHQMLQLSQRPEWRTIEGGSEKYVQAIQKNMTGNIHLSAQVTEVVREGNHVIVRTEDSEQIFDYVVFATHPDITSQLIKNLTEQENKALSAIQYVPNQMDLHTDESLLPKNKKAWASWSVNRHKNPKKACTVNYYMNLLQSLETEKPIIVSLNQSDYVDPSKVLMSKTYHHPVYNKKTLQAQKQINKLQGEQHTYFCGAYLGWGFHEDGARSGAEVAAMIKNQL